MKMNSRQSKTYVMSTGSPEKDFHSDTGLSKKDINISTTEPDIYKNWRNNNKQSPE